MDCKVPLCAVAEVKFADIEEKWQVRFDAIQDSINKSERLLAIRLEDMNNLRIQIQEERRVLATRREALLLNFIISIVVVVVGCFLTYMLMH